MCNCLFVEYRCSCSKPDCPHLKPKHKNYHAAKALFQIDHFRWNHCTRYLASVGIPVSNDKDSVNSQDHSTLKEKEKSKRKTLKSYFTKPSKKDRNDGSSVNYKSIDENGEAVSFWSDGSDTASKEALVELNDQSSIVKQPAAHFPVKKSGDPRHGGEMPECESISYEGWCIERRNCRGCEDYWKRRDKDA